MTDDHFISALDIGTTKVACLLASRSEEGVVRACGFGHYRSAGLKSGVVVNKEAVTQAILEAVSEAENMAQQTVKDITFTVTGGFSESRIVSHSLDLERNVVRTQDVRSLLKEGKRIPEGTELLHAVPLDFRLDDSVTLSDPRGLHAHTLTLRTHQILGHTSGLENLRECVSDAHLDVRGVMMSPYAGGLSTLVQDERTLGAILIDMGGGTTSYAAFVEGSIVHAGVLPLGGMHITNDIARGLTTPVEHAEKLKILYGSLSFAEGGRAEEGIVEVPQVGEDAPIKVPLSHLTAIIRPRVDEILDMLKTRLDEDKVFSFSVQRVVLTGGCSQLPGMRDLVAEALGKHVRLGRPLGVSSLTEKAGGPAFSALVGALLCVARQSREERLAPRSRFHRFRQWVRGTFNQGV